MTSQGRRPAQARGGSANQYRSSHGYRSPGPNGTGYNLRQHDIRFNGRSGGLLGNIAGNPRAIVALAIFIGLIILLIFGVTSCVRGCAKKSETPQASSQDPRVAAGLSTDLTDKLIAKLDQDALMAQIAAGADKITDTRLIDLALREPTSMALVAGLTAEEPQLTVKPYGSEASKGTYPQLYTWDERWGYATFNKGMLAITGSGPTAFGMAYLGLTGKSDLTPADFAGLIENDNQLDETYGMKPTFVEPQAKKLGIAVFDFTPSGETLTDVIESGTVMLVQLKAGTFGDEPHWALVVGENLDGSVNLNDPISTANTARPWDPATVAGNSETFFALRLRTADDADAEGSGEGGTDADAEGSTDEVDASASE